MTWYHLKILPRNRQIIWKRWDQISINVLVKLYPSNRPAWQSLLCLLEWMCINSLLYCVNTFTRTIAHTVDRVGPCLGQMSNLIEKRKRKNGSSCLRSTKNLYHPFLAMTRWYICSKKKGTVHKLKWKSTQKATKYYMHWNTVSTLEYPRDKKSCDRWWK